MGSSWGSKEPRGNGKVVTGAKWAAPAPEAGAGRAGGLHGAALPWVLADGGVQAGAPAVQLVQSVCPQDLKMQRLVKLAQHRGAEVYLQFSLATGRHDPPEAIQPGG